MFLKKQRHLYSSKTKICFCFVAGVLIAATSMTGYAQTSSATGNGGGTPHTPGTFGTGATDSESNSTTPGTSSSSNGSMSGTGTGTMGGSSTTGGTTGGSSGSR